MGIVCPTVLAATTLDYAEQLNVVSEFSRRIQIDLGDGKFTTKTIDVTDVWWPDTLYADVHLMFEYFDEALPLLVANRPHMVILHAEAHDDIAAAITYLHSQGVKAGVALLQDTDVESTRTILELADHVLIFSGSLGSFGGTVDFSLLKKVKDIRAIKPELEIGWDGGINVDNIRKLVDGGIDVLNVGGAIQKANQPENAYRDLVRRAFN